MAQAPNLPDYSDIHLSVLRTEHEYLLEYIDFVPLHDHLISRQVFDNGTLADMKEEPKTSGKIRCLLEKLKKDDQEKYNKFKEALQKTKQGHIVKLLEKKEEEEKERLRASAEIHSSHSEKACQPQEISHTPIAQPTSSVREGQETHAIHGENDQDP